MNNIRTDMQYNLNMLMINPLWYNTCELDIDQWTKAIHTLYHNDHFPLIKPTHI